LQFQDEKKRKKNPLLFAKNCKWSYFKGSEAAIRPHVTVEMGLTPDCGKSEQKPVRKLFSGKVSGAGPGISSFAT